MNENGNSYREFIDTASHELQAPLRKLSIFVEKFSGICKDEKSAESQEYVERIHSCLAEMRALVNGLSEWSDVYKQELKSVPCNVDSIAKEVLTEMKDDFDKKNALVQCSELPVLIGDPGQLKILFKSLLSNTVKFHQPDRPLKVEISAESLTESGTRLNGLNPSRSYTLIRIRDNGIGFKPGQVDNLFKPFGRLNGKSEYPGSGLGLSICKTIVENHAGLLYGKGDERGACFELILPEMPA